MFPKAYCEKNVYLAAKTASEKKSQKFSDVMEPL